MKPGSQKPGRFRQKPASDAGFDLNLESQLVAYFAKLKQPSADFDQRLINKIRTLDHRIVRGVQLTPSLTQ
jgi:hypothetical protein